MLANFKSNRTGRGFKAYLALDPSGKIGFEFEAKAGGKAPTKKRAGEIAATKSADKPKRASRTKAAAEA